MRRRRVAVTAAVAAAVAALLTWSVSVVAAPARPRTIAVVCSSIEDLCRTWAEEYTRETGVGVDMVRLSSGEALARLSRPGGADEFDVWHGGPAESYIVAGQRGLLLPYVSPEASAVLPAYRDAAGAWTGVYLGVLGFCSNRDVLDRLGVPTPTSWDDLLSPRLVGQVSVPNPVTSGTGYTHVWTQRARLGSDDAAVAYLRRLDRNVLQYTASGMSPPGVAARGEVAIALAFTQHCVKAQREGHPDLVVTYPREGTGFEIGSVAIVAGTRQRDLARRYVDFAISAAGQRLGADTNSRQLPTRPDVPTDPRLAVGVPLLGMESGGDGLQGAADARARLTQRVVAEVQR